MNMRLFIAIPLPTNVAHEILDIQKRLQRAGVDYDWEPIEKLHVTLAFLGEISGEDIERVKQLLSRLSLPQSALRFKYLRPLPSPWHPHVLTVEADATMKLERAFFMLNKELAENHLPTHPHGKFIPHVTIGRHPRQKRMRIPPIPFDITFQAESITLFASTLHPEGSRYSQLVSYPLAS